MMDFSPQTPRRRPSENIVPMINVVFLLLIFFLMSAQIAPTDPVEIAPPVGNGDTERPLDHPLFIDANGTLFFAETSGEAVFERLSARATDRPLFIRADAELPATILAELLPKLVAAGVAKTRLIVGAE